MNTVNKLKVLDTKVESVQNRYYVMIHARKDYNRIQDPAGLLTKIEEDK